MRTLPLLIFWTLWCLLIWLAPSTVYWRDSGEFIIQAFYLDIAHPAGFPNYGMIANLFALLPWGPIPWRVILCSSCCLALTIALLYEILRYLLPESLNRSPIYRVLATLLSLMLLLGTLPLTLKQGLSAEVYTLNAGLLLLIGVLTLCGVLQKDFRYLASAAFIGGTTIGNHVSSGLSALLLLPILLTISPLVRKRCSTLIVFILMGGATYVYLPIRATHHLPLNTGSPTTISRFWNVISDARDRVLRHNADKPESNDNQGFSKLIPDPTSNIRNDASKLGLTNSTLGLVAILALLGIIAFQRSTPFLILTPIALGNYLFFSGWDGDPWIVAVGTGATFITAALFHLVSIIRARSLTFISSCALVILAAYYGPFDRLLSDALFLKTYQTPAKIVRTWISSSSAPLTISENSWFIIRYLETIEGIGDDRTNIYQPSVLFPEYFAPIKIVFANNRTLDGNSTSNLTGLEPLQSLGHLIESGAKSGLQIEPSLATNQAIAQIAHYRDSGAVEIRQGINQNQQQRGNAHSLNNILNTLASESAAAPEIVSHDAQNYFENIFAAQLDLLTKQKRTEEALSQISSICRRADSKRCSIATLNHKGLILLAAQRFHEAKEHYLELVKAFPASALAIEPNLALANAGLASKSTKITN